LGLVTWWGLGRLTRAFGRSPRGAGTDVPAVTVASGGDGDGTGTGTGTGGEPRNPSGAEDPVRSP
jgi:hypothetical protein